MDERHLESGDGCTQISAGCDNCYALTLAHRLLRKHYTRKRPERDTRENRRDPFAVRLWPERLIGSPCGSFLARFSAGLRQRALA